MKEHMRKIHRNGSQVPSNKIVKKAENLLDLKTIETLPTTDVWCLMGIDDSTNLKNFLEKID